MKRFICITIALCLIFGSICPVFGVTDINIYNYNPSGNFATLMASVIATIANINTNFQNWATLTGAGNSGLGATFQDFMLIISHIDDWFFPQGARPSGVGTLYELLLNEATVVAGYLPDIPTIASYTYSFMNSNMSNLDALKKALTNYRPGETSTWSNFTQLYAQAHRSLFKIQSGTNALSSAYEFRNIGSSGSYTDPTYYWTYGSPIGNLANMFQKYNLNFVNSYVNRWSADLTHYNDQLSTWDSAGNNGNTLEQVLFTPESAIQGLYRYLAFTQRDVARLTFTLANEKDQQIRESTEDQQDQLYYSFLDPGDQSNPAASGRVSDSDIGDMGDLSAGFKDNMNTGVSASSVWSVFDSSRYNWFTQATKNSLDTVPATRDVYDTTDYPTPLLDAYYSEMFSILGIEIDESR